MTTKQKLELREREIKGRLGELAALEGEQRTEAVETEQRALLAEVTGLQPRIAAAEVAEDADDRLRGEQTNGDGENRELVELRSRARLGNYLTARMRGQMANGAERELSEAAGVEGIPLELWDVPRVGEQRDISGAPGNRGNQPGHDSTGRVRAKHRPAARYRNAAGWFRNLCVGDHRHQRDGWRKGEIGRCTGNGGDVQRHHGNAEEGKRPSRTGPSKTSRPWVKKNFEAALRENVSLALSDELDKQAINGDGVAPNLSGILLRTREPGCTGCRGGDLRRLRNGVR